MTSTMLRQWRQQTRVTRSVIGIVLATFFSDVGHADALARLGEGSRWRGERRA